MEVTYGNIVDFQEREKGGEIKVLETGSIVTLGDTTDTSHVVYDI